MFKFSTFLALFLLLVVLQEPALALKKSYVVYLGGHSHGRDATTADLRRVTDSHHQLLASVLGSVEKAKESIFYSYERHINGFAAILEEEEAAQLAKQPGVVSVFLNKPKKLHTTHSWDFLMLERRGGTDPSSIWNKARFGEDTIIANLDTGVWPESKSFSDEGIGPIPSKWKGVCQFGDSAKNLCNRKLIGARYFSEGYIAATKLQLNATYETARDNDGHGTHTLSTAGGAFVPGASVFGLGNGTAKGGSPRARVASYKVCWPPYNSIQCTDADIIKAFDMAIHDGVDVISASVGGSGSVPYINEGFAIGSFHAVKNGIIVVASAGNDGTTPKSVSNIAPWIITVGASTIDRNFQANVVLKTGQVFEGIGLSAPLPDKSFYPLMSAADAKASNVSVNEAILCKPGTLDPQKAKGKILLCLRGDSARTDKGEQALIAGAAGMILCNAKTDYNDLIADPHVLPATQVNHTNGQLLFAYANSTENAQVLITPSKVVFGVNPSPFMAAFSSRGPNTVNPEILKPDITAPGVNIIAAYSESASPTDSILDTRRTPFVTESGTSMSCPHVSGVVGLLKTLYPHWSPAAIKSAIMTTALTSDGTGNPLLDSDYSVATPFQYGSGHIQANQAMNPGLVYDVSISDYLDFLCGAGYNETMLNTFIDYSYTCPDKYSTLDYNNPSISVLNISQPVTVTRRVKNVGNHGMYASHIRQPTGVSISVEPKMLKFEKIGEEKSFKVTISPTKDMTGYEFGELTWSDGTHYVRSPIVVS